MNHQFAVFQGAFWQFHRAVVQHVGNNVIVVVGFIGRDCAGQCQFDIHAVRLEVFLGGLHPGLAAVLADFQHDIVEFRVFGRLIFADSLLEFLRDVFGGQRFLYQPGLVVHNARCTARRAGVGGGVNLGLAIVPAMVFGLLRVAAGAGAGVGLAVIVIDPCAKAVRMLMLFCAVLVGADIHSRGAGNVVAEEVLLQRVGGIVLRLVAVAAHLGNRQALADGGTAVRQADARKDRQIKAAGRGLDIAAFLCRHGNACARISDHIDLNAAIKVGTALQSLDGLGIHKAVKIREQCLHLLLAVQDDIVLHRERRALVNAFYNGSGIEDVVLDLAVQSAALAEAIAAVLAAQAVGGDYDIVIEVGLVIAAAEHRVHLIAKDDQVVVDGLRRAGIVQRAVLAYRQADALGVLDTDVVTHDRAGVHSGHKQAEAAVVAIGVVILEHSAPAEHIGVKCLGVIADPNIVDGLVVLCHSVLGADEPQTGIVCTALQLRVLTVAHRLFLILVVAQIGVARIGQVVVLQHRLVGRGDHHAVTGNADNVVVADADIVHVGGELGTAVALPCQNIVADALDVAVHHNVIVDLQVVIRAVHIDAAAQLAAGARSTVVGVIARDIVNVAIVNDDMLQLARTVERFLLVSGDLGQPLGLEIVEDHRNAVASGSALIQRLLIVRDLNAADFPVLDVEKLDRAGGIEFTPCFKCNIGVLGTVSPCAVTVQDGALGAVAAVIVLGQHNGCAGCAGALGLELYAAPGAGGIQIDMVTGAKGNGFQLFKGLPRGLRGVAVLAVIAVLGQVILRGGMCLGGKGCLYRAAIGQHSGQRMAAHSQTLEGRCRDRQGVVILRIVGGVRRGRALACAPLPCGQLLAVDLNGRKVAVALFIGVDAELLVSRVAAVHGKGLGRKGIRRIGQLDRAGLDGFLVRGGAVFDNADAVNKLAVLYGREVCTVVCPAAQKGQRRDLLVGCTVFQLDAGLFLLRRHAVADFRVGGNDLAVDLLGGAFARNDPLELVPTGAALHIGGAEAVILIADAGCTDTVVCLGGIIHECSNAAIVEDTHRVAVVGVDAEAEFDLIGDLVGIVIPCRNCHIGLRLCKVHLGVALRTAQGCGLTPEQRADLGLTVGIGSGCKELVALKAVCKDNTGGVKVFHIGRDPDRIVLAGLIAGLDMQGAVHIHLNILVVRGVDNAGYCIVLCLVQIDAAILANFQDIILSVLIDQLKLVRLRRGGRFFLGLDGNGCVQLCLFGCAGVRFQDIQVINKMLVLHIFFGFCLVGPVGGKDSPLDGLYACDRHRDLVALVADGLTVNFHRGTGGGHVDLHLVPALGTRNVGGLPRTCCAVGIGLAVGARAGSGILCTADVIPACGDRRAEEQIAVAVHTDAELVLVKIGVGCNKFFRVGFFLGAGVIIPEHDGAGLVQILVIKICAVCTADRGRCHSARAGAGMLAAYRVGNLARLGGGQSARCLQLVAVQQLVGRVIVRLSGHMQGLFYRLGAVLQGNGAVCAQVIAGGGVPGQGHGNAVHRVAAAVQHKAPGLGRVPFLCAKGKRRGGGLLSRRFGHRLQLLRGKGRRFLGSGFLLGGLLLDGLFLGGLFLDGLLLGGLFFNRLFLGRFLLCGLLLGGLLGGGFCGQLHRVIRQLAFLLCCRLCHRQSLLRISRRGHHAGTHTDCQQTA